MDSFFGIGLPELVLILIIAGVVMGPERLTVAARWLGKTTSQLQNISRTFFRQLNDEVSRVDSDGSVKSTFDELNLLRRQVEELQAEFKATATGLASETQSAIEATRQEINNTIAPPELQLTPESETDSYRPPSLTSESTPANGNAQISTATQDTLPNRTTTSDDPE